ncbi:beta-ketoacyl-[acyl-carrier-protein] synthase II [Pseudorhodoferax aquiterrae]|uniref:Beta-ketoacyl-[acyl-carrier-protein] synthase II n=1 Tax=Pseudorhodoferax aquiterrae TaxID=747304 RepID=A0ABQ3GBF3_9BURK|nr:beta-ketoacyl-[acyl-carrier-protein] synthase family protein [Pseudorhodoferax aquiterrae]GHD00347.1 beta-ketoacyl-[acyl-carrier-protein] synthase II [Pseudorhodoferax aquiterrae]
MNPLAISAFTLTTALGAGRAATLAALQAQRSGLAPLRFMDLPLSTWAGEVEGVDGVRLPAPLATLDCRNNRLAWLGLSQDGFVDAVARARERWGARRVGVFLGTSTSGLLQTELAYRNRQEDGSLPEAFRYAETQNTYSLALFTAEALQLAGPRFVVSTACSSSAKVFGNAQRMLQAGWIDAAVVGGVDSLCLTTLYGFNALELLAPEACRPWDAQRRGLSIGEAAAFALIERDADAPEGWVLGVGETNDGHHMSTPHPEGAGAIAAMRAALDAAALAPADIDYINLHGTATPTNDASEDRAVRAVFGAATPPCSSTKGATGHTLGAAGGVEAAISLLALQHGFMPGGLNRRQPDPELHVPYLDHNRNAPLRRVLSNSFGFGGTNASLVLGKDRA